MPVHQETPPLAWGRRADGWRVDGCAGNTPTRVGKTIAPRMSRNRRRKHPHSRGEDPWSASCRHCQSETPPLAWGRLERRVHHQRPDGNTPTRVGKTQPLAAAGLSGRKHPHSRGEDDARGRVLVGQLETPPLAWGRPAPIARGVADGRNTPTRVGKTRVPLMASFAPRKHPHSRGEDCIMSTTPLATAETPPLAWGRRGHRAQSTNRRRNTPTRVGKTRPAVPPALGPRKHPHSRGEDIVSSSVSDTA